MLHPRLISIDTQCILYIWIIFFFVKQSLAWSHTSMALVRITHYTNLIYYSKCPYIFLVSLYWLALVWHRTQMDDKRLYIHFPNRGDPDYLENQDSKPCLLTGLQLLSDTGWWKLYSAIKRPQDWWIFHDIGQD